MKRIFCLVVAVLMCASLALSVAAVEGTFVPSITYKDSPEVIDAKLGDENVIDCLVVTSIIEAQDKTTDITQDERDLLLEVYEKLNDGSMTLPLNEDYVIRELLDVNFKYNDCRTQDPHGHKDEHLNEDGVTATITFDLNLDADTDLVVLSYHDGVWTPIKSVTNNGDGTVTCVFEHFCPVAFAVKQAQGPSAETGDVNGKDLVLWSILLVASAAALVATVAVYTRNRKHA